MTNSKINEEILNQLVKKNFGSWKNYCKIHGYDYSNFKRKLIRNLDKIENWLVPVGAEIKIFEKQEYPVFSTNEKEILYSPPGTGQSILVKNIENMSQDELRLLKLILNLNDEDIVRLIELRKTFQVPTPTEPIKKK